MTKPALEFVVALVVAVPVCGQSVSNSSGTVVRVGQLSAISTASVAGNAFQPLTGRPYSAEQVTEHAQILADGTHITGVSQRTKLYRDSAGRTRTEHIVVPPAGAVIAQHTAFIEIVDPVAGYLYMLDENNRVARRSAWPPTIQRAINTTSTNTASFSSKPAPTVVPPNGAVSATRTGPTRPHPQNSHESLGTQTIEGVLAEGKRMTTIYPEGFFGNDRPITTVTETWMSPDLKLMVLSNTSDPRSGETTIKTINISQAEPDAALFQVPADYSIVDEQQPGAGPR
jgi:hypothetical protein